MNNEKILQKLKKNQAVVKRIIHDTKHVVWLELPTDSVYTRDAFGLVYDIKVWEKIVKIYVSSSCYDNIVVVVDEPYYSDDPIEQWDFPTYWKRCIIKNVIGIKK